MLAHVESQTPAITRNRLLRVVQQQAFEFGQHLWPDGHLHQNNVSTVNAQLPTSNPQLPNDAKIDPYVPCPERAIGS